MNEKSELRMVDLIEQTANTEHFSRIADTLRLYNHVYGHVDCYVRYRFCPHGLYHDFALYAA